LITRRRIISEFDGKIFANLRFDFIVVFAVGFAHNQLLLQKVYTKILLYKKAKKKQGVIYVFTP